MRLLGVMLFGPVTVALLNLIEQPMFGVTINWEAFVPQSIVWICAAAVAWTAKT